MAHTNPKKVVSLLNQVKSLIVEGDSTVDVDALITAAQVEVDAIDSVEVQSVFKQVCVAKLRATDWSQLSDNGLSAEEKTAHDQYRTDLRAMVVPTTEADLEAVVWPTEPV